MLAGSVSVAYLVVCIVAVTLALVFAVRFMRTSQALGTLQADYKALENKIIKLESALEIAHVSPVYNSREAQNTKEPHDTPNSLIIRLDADARILDMNKAAIEFFGLQELALRNRPLVGTLFAANDLLRRDLSEALARLTNSPQIVAEFSGEVLDCNNQRRWISWSFTSGAGADKKAFRAIGHDITERKSLEDSLARINVTDPLTGVLNRENIEHIAERAFKKAVRYNEPFSIILFELDIFTSFAHKTDFAISDTLISDIARHVAQLVGKDGEVGRIKSLRFMVVMPDTPRFKAREMAQRIHLRVLETSQKHNENPNLVTTSVGVATRTMRDQSYENMVLHARDALSDHEAYNPAPDDDQTASDKVPEHYKSSSVRPLKPVHAGLPRASTPQQDKVGDESTSLDELLFI